MYQARNLKLETWNGERWAKPPKDLTPKIDYVGMGGGSLQARPGMRASKWILRAPGNIRIWKIFGLEFF